MTNVTQTMLYIVRGLPGSGKTTLAHKLASVVCEADHYFIRDGQYRFDPSGLSEAHKACYEATRAGLLAGSTVAVANTFTRRWEFARYVDLAAELNVPVQIIVCQGNWKNTHGVPESTIQQMRARWEW